MVFKLFFEKKERLIKVDLIFVFYYHKTVCFKKIMFSGDANFRHTASKLNIRGYDWVGWRNDTEKGDKPIEIKFEFETTRNFSSVTINCNNLFSKNVRVFKSALIYFSIGGKYFFGTPIKYLFDKD